jgi:hypothetical protein
VKTALIFFTNQVGIGILSLPGMMHTIGMIPGIETPLPAHVAAPARLHTLA